MAEGGRGLTRGDTENRLKFMKNFKFFSSLKQIYFQVPKCRLLPDRTIANRLLRFRLVLTFNFDQHVQ